MTDIIKLYNPANAAALTQEEIINLQSLKLEQIKELAKAYPNSSHTRAYLLIIDSKKPVEKQLPQLSTWQNLYNLITRNGLRGFVAYGFRATTQKPNRTIGKVSKVRRSEVLDLSDQELMTLPGFRTKAENGEIRTHPSQTVTITKVKNLEPTTTVTSNVEIKTTNL